MLANYKRSGETLSLKALRFRDASGAYGAYTWGVLDRLLREDDVFPSAISGASAGVAARMVKSAPVRRPCDH